MLSCFTTRTIKGCLVVCVSIGNSQNLLLYVHSVDNTCMYVSASDVFVFAVFNTYSIRK